MLRDLKKKITRSYGGRIETSLVYFKADSLTYRNLLRFLCIYSTISVKI